MDEDEGFHTVWYNFRMAAPLIGLTTRSLVDLRGIFVDRSQAVSEDYVEALRWAGGHPVLIPSSLPAAEALEIAARLGGIVLTGGPDVDPVHFDEEPQAGLGNIDPVRDAAELALCRLAEERDMPLLAVCRGIQVLNVAFGGGVIQHMDPATGAYLNHDLATFRSGPGHSIEVVPGTKLAGIMGAGAHRVNSSHHQAVGEVPSALEVNARAPDGVVEGLERPDCRFIVGVEWHPERCYLQSPASAALLRSFVEACMA